MISLDRMTARPLKIQITSHGWTLSNAMQTALSACFPKGTSLSIGVCSQGDESKLWGYLFIEVKSQSAWFVWNGCQSWVRYLRLWCEKEINAFVFKLCHCWVSVRVFYFSIIFYPNKYWWPYYYSCNRQRKKKKKTLKVKLLACSHTSNKWHIWV